MESPVALFHLHYGNNPNDNVVKAFRLIITAHKSPVVETAEAAEWTSAGPSLRISAVPTFSNRSTYEKQLKVGDVFHGLPEIASELWMWYRKTHPNPGPLVAHSPDPFYLCGTNKRSTERTQVLTWIRAMVHRDFPGIEADSKSPTMTSIIPELVVLSRSLLEKGYLARPHLSCADLVLFPVIHLYLSNRYQEGPRAVLLENLEPLIALLFWFDTVQQYPPVIAARDKHGYFPFIDIRGVFPSTLGTLEECLARIKAIHHTSIVSDKSQKVLTLRVDPAQVFEKLRPVLPHLGVALAPIDPNQVIHWDRLPELLDPTAGKLSNERALRKRHQIANLVHIARRLIKDGETIVDFCGGGGHLSLVLAYLFPKVKVVLLDKNAVSLGLARRRRQELKLENLEVVEARLEDWTSTHEFHLGMAIHACGLLSDLVMERCFTAKAGYLVAPCCVGSLQNTARISFPRSRYYSEDLHVDHDDYCTLAASADRATSSWNFATENYRIGKQAMALVDFDRNSLAVEHRYSTFQFTMNPETCTPKNDVILGVPQERLPTLGLANDLSFSDFQSAFPEITIRAT